MTPTEVFARPAARGRVVRVAERGRSHRKRAGVAAIPAAVPAVACVVLVFLIGAGPGGAVAADTVDTAAPSPAPVPAPGASLPAGLSAEDREQVERDLKTLGEKLTALRAAAAGDAAKLDHLADADLFHKGVVWALRYETELTPDGVALIKKSLERGHERADVLAAAGKAPPPWGAKKGRVLRGYVSAVDGSTQPYGVVVPAGYDGTRPVRLDVVLHGSTRPVGLSELRFGAPFDEGDEGGGAGADTEFIELHPLGRVENCYRWAGEADVFEAIESVCRQYRVDRDRVVLRGMSMGASGTWHLGLKHPDRFVALGPYCGYVDTHRFSETPVGGFVRVGPLPPHQERVLHMLDSVDYAANAGVVPAVAAIGEKDVFFQAHVIMGEAMAAEGLSMVNLVSPDTGHEIDPVTFREQMRRIGGHAARGLDRAPRKLRFVTWTLKYNRCHWLELLSLGEHYARAEIEATVADDGSVDVVTPKNVTRLAIHPPVLQGAPARVRIGGADVPLPPRPAGAGDGPQALVFGLGDGGKWTCLGRRGDVPLAGKRPGVQGPIDDAFTAPFLCVRGTGRPWNPWVGAWADASLRRFAYEYARYLRADLPVKDDTAVTEDDVRTKHLILFGDPGSNAWIAKALAKLPITWGRDELRVGDRRYAAKDHAPALVCASPLPGAGDHYLVLNSGHTFHEQEFAAVNYLLFPRLGDWAVMRITGDAGQWQPQPASGPFPEEAVRAGFFDEQWELPAAAAP